MFQIMHFSPSAELVMTNKRGDLHGLNQNNVSFLWSFHFVVNVNFVLALILLKLDYQ